MLGRHEKLCMIKWKILGDLKFGDDATWFKWETSKNESSFENVGLNKNCRIESQERYFEKLDILRLKLRLNDHHRIESWERYFETLDIWDKNQD